MDKKGQTLWEEYSFDKRMTLKIFDKPILPYPKDEMPQALDQGKFLYPDAGEVQRAWALMAVGARTTAHAENVVIDGCANAFLAPTQTIGPYFQLLNVMGIKYQLLSKQYCCGCTILAESTPEKWEETLTLAKSLNQRNFDLAKELGAKHVYWYCHGCQPMSQYLDTKDSGVTIGHALDILIEPLKKVKKLKAKPARVGYFRGCWRWHKALNPNFKLNWDTWRSWLDHIEGIEVVDLPDICCAKNPQAIAKKIKDSNVDYTVTLCNNCRRTLNILGAKTIMLNTLLLEAVTYEG
jgi:Fe-S oxidoreductase